MRDYAFTRSRIFQWMGILLSLGIIAVGYWWYQSQASTTINKNLSDSLSTGLNLYWPLDDGTSGATPTTAADSSPNSNTGTLTGGPTWTTGQVVSAVDFDGTDDYVTVADSDVLDVVDSRNFTLSGWFNRDTFTTDDTIIAKSNGQAAGDTGYVVYVDDTNDDLVFDITDGTDEYSRTSTSTFTSTGWNHFVAVFEDAVGMTIYINGSVNQDAASGTLGNIGSLANSVAFRAGAESDAGNPFDGKLDEVRLYNRALSGDEVSQLYRLTTPTGVDTSLKGYWPFDGDDVSGTTTYDRSGVGSTGTLTNGPTLTRGKIGQAISFDGSNDKVTLADNAVFDVGGAGTWCNWFYSTGNQSSRGMFSHNVSGGDYVMINGYLTTNSSVLSGYVRVGGTAYTATTPGYATGYWNNQWHHVCTTFDKTLSSQRLKVYADGVLHGTHDAANGNIDAGNTPMVGNWVFGGGEQTSFQGYIDDMRIYNRALTVAEIKALYDQGQSDKTNTSATQPQGTGNLDSSLALYWRLDDGTSGATPTTATDSSTNGNTGTLTNSPTWTTGQVVNVVDFDGTDDYVTVADPASGVLDVADSTHFTLSGWFNRDTFTTDDTILAKSNGQAASDTGYNVYIDDSTDKVTFVANDGTDQYKMESVSTFTTTGWNHYTIVWDDSGSGQTKLYINGSLEGATTTGTFANVNSLANSVAFRAGAESDAGNPFDGKLDEVRLYNRALSGDEVSQLYRLTTPTGVDTSLKGYWSFNAQDTSGTTAYDRSGLGNSGTLTSGPTKVVGKIGQALSFDGSNDRVSVPTNSAYNVSNITVGAWIKTTADGMIVSRDIFPASRQFQLRVNSNVINFIIFTGSGNVVSLSGVTLLNDNSWHHVVGTYDAANIKVYVDGKLDASAAETRSLDSGGTDALEIGTNEYQAAAYTAFFTGSIDEVRFYSRALALTEIKSLYDVGQSDKTNSSVSQPQGTGRLDSGLTGYWRLDEGSGTNATDSSSAGNTGTITGSPTWITGQIGGGITFNGSTQYIGLGTSSVFDFGSGDFTLSIWSNDGNAASGTRCLICDDTGNGRGKVLTVASGVYTFTTNDTDDADTQALSSSSGYANNQWHHVVGVRKGPTYSLYVDGILRNSATNSNIGNTNDTGQMMLASRDDGTPLRFDGSLDEARIYNRGLSAEEVANLYGLTSPTGTDTSLKGYWSFNGQDVSGTTVYDRSGAGNTGTLTNGPTKTRGKIGQAISFDGSDDYVNAGTGVSITGAITLSLWAKTSATGNQTLLGTRTVGNAGYMFTMLGSGNSYKLRFTYFGVFDWDSSANVYSADGNWHHYTVVNNLTDVRFYVDGTLVSTVASGTSGTSSNVFLALGALNDQYSAGTVAAFFNGSLDEIRAYNTALSASQIASIYNQGR